MLSAGFRTCAPIETPDDARALAFAVRGAWDGMAMGNCARGGTGRGAVGCGGGAVGVRRRCGGGAAAVRCGCRYNRQGSLDLSLMILDYYLCV